MQIEIRNAPAFGIARLTLEPNETVRAEAGAMMATSDGVVLEAKAEGGVLKSLKRAALGGESFFLTTYKAPSQGGFVDVAPRLAGDVIVLDTPAEGLVVQRGSWLASALTVNIDTKWGGFKNFFGSEGGFIMHASGSGPIVIACYGALETWNLAPGEKITVDTGHMVAYDASVQMSLRKATGGIVQMVKTGEGLVFDFTGPGRVLVQSRNPNEFLGWIQAALGSSNGSSGPAASLGGLFSRD
ncbi:MAG: TIGR00266 family protein [Actinobacteria bacterium]|jgi:uncharacterized protein (TIGR00266 family)|nr:TIGR00266 family protein [Actinomycetota bacterium]